MNKKPSILHDPSRFTRDIARTDEFREERTKEYLPGANLRRAVRVGSRALYEANLSEHGNETREWVYMKVHDDSITFELYTP